MNNNFQKRNIETTLKRYLGLFPAVALTGPRQSGKSTLLREVFTPEYTYLTLDDPIAVDYLREDPRGFIKKYHERIIFDEAQKAPELFNYLKIEIDNDRMNYGKFIITGSSQFNIIKEITESLAGRVGSLSLLPFEYNEIPAKNREKQMLLGSYPELVMRGFAGSKEWYGSYITNYIERDVRSLYNVGNLRDFHRLIFLLAARCAQELNMSELASEIGVSVKTIKAWISILEASYIIFLLNPYHKNLGKRIVKRPKIYFYDTGIICFLTGATSQDNLERGPLGGPVFENYIIAETLKRAKNTGQNMSLFYFRSNLGIEVDLIIQNTDTAELIYTEIKNTHTPRKKMVESLMKLMEIEKETVQIPPLKISGILVYRGEESGPMYDGITIMNYKKFISRL